eukprot:4016073-Amphidinium_carterae.1
MTLGGIGGWDGSGNLLCFEEGLKHSFIDLEAKLPFNCCSSCCCLNMNTMQRNAAVDHYGSLSNLITQGHPNCS